MARPKSLNCPTFRQRLEIAAQEKFGREVRQVDIARMAGVKQPSVSLWNKKDGGPRLGIARQLAEKLDVCVEWLYTGRGPMRPPPDDPVMRELLALWPHLNEGTRRDLLGFARIAADGDAQARL
jgi:DNA-binding XRE family transcriptional regulator